MNKSLEQLIGWSRRPHIAPWFGNVAGAATSFAFDYIEISAAFMAAALVNTGMNLVCNYSNYKHKKEIIKRHEDIAKYDSGACGAYQEIEEWWIDDAKDGRR